MKLQAGDLSMLRRLEEVVGRDPLAPYGRGDADQATPATVPAPEASGSESKKGSVEGKAEGPPETKAAQQGGTASKKLYEVFREGVVSLRAKTEEALNEHPQVAQRVRVALILAVLAALLCGGLALLLRAITPRHSPRPKPPALSAGLSEKDARARVAVLDSQGSLVEGSLSDAYKAELAWPPELARRHGIDPEGDRGLAACVDALKPTVRISTSGQPGVFDERIVRAMAAHVDRPVIFSFSNPAAGRAEVDRALLGSDLVSRRRGTGQRGSVERGHRFTGEDLVGDLPALRGEGAF